MKYDAAQLLALYRNRGVPCAPLNTYSQVLADPQVEHMGWIEVGNSIEEAFATAIQQKKVTYDLERLMTGDDGVDERLAALSEHVDRVENGWRHQS